MIKLIPALLMFLLPVFTIAQQFTLKTEHPRLNVDNSNRQVILTSIQNDETAKNAFNQMKTGIDTYVTRHQTDSTWIVSRLQMYWKTHSTDVFIKGGKYDHAEGQAPVPTVRFPGARDNVTIYGAPKLEDITPYMDDARGVYLVNRSKPGQPMEWAEISQTGRTIESINSNIMQLANTAALVYWINGEEKYARFAADLFDTYMTGMYYRKEPYDLTHGHHQTIAGLSTFEVIQEVAIINNLTGIYDYMYSYFEKRSPQKLSLYTDVLKKWADVQIKHGVAFNNWDLMQARNILNIGTVLGNNSNYRDGKGTGYYVDQVLNKNSERQWSVTKLVNEGYDPVAGLWYECPGYSIGVLGDFTGFVSFFDKQYNYDILPQMPVLQKAVIAIAQYLFPNGYTTAFGDSHYRRISTAPAQELVANAQKYYKVALEDSLTKFIKTINFYNGESNRNSEVRRGVNSLLSKESALQLKPVIQAGRVEDYVSNTFFSPNVSYFALRNGMDAKNGLMVAMSGSKGNHMHAGGISMEMYGKGLVLAPESGIGTSYFQQDYAEYYSQFPAHNTVAVDGISAYPVMKSNHGFDVVSSYPASDVKQGIFTKVSFGELSFVEPETGSDQNRLTSIIRTSDSTGYYVDIFRSHKKNGGDKMHDYFYHNIGQQLTFSDANGKPLDLAETEKLSFSGGHLFAYDYFWDKKSITTNQDFRATFQLNVPGRESIFMNAWMKGSPDREIFSVKAPASKAFGGNTMIPDSIAALPMPTIVARQYGEAWKRPFVAVYEPSTTSQPRSVLSINSFKSQSADEAFTGLVVESKTGSKEFIFSNSNATNDVVYNNKSFSGTYGVISELNGHLNYLFLASGKKIASQGYCITGKTSKVSAALSHDNGIWFYTSNKPVSITMPTELFDGNTSIKLVVNNRLTTFKGKRVSHNGSTILSFDLPAAPYSQIKF